LCGMLIDFDLAVKRGPEGGTANDNKAFLTGTENFMASAIFTARDRITNGQEFPSAHSPIFDLESFFWVLVYVPLYYHIQGGTSKTPDASTFSHLFESFPASESKRSIFLVLQGDSENLYNEDCCLSPWMDLLRPLMVFLSEYHRQSLQAMNWKARSIREAGYIGNSRKTTKGGKGGKGGEVREVRKVENAGEVDTMCPWTEGEENMAVDEFIDILSDYPAKARLCLLGRRLKDWTKKRCATVSNRL
ncbi:hypothetical protein B9479_006810, partial [Cryptococcus floricola]